MEAQGEDAVDPVDGVESRGRVDFEQRIETEETVCPFLGRGIRRAPWPRRHGSGIRFWSFHPWCFCLRRLVAIASCTGGYRLNYPQHYRRVAGFGLESSFISTHCLRFVMTSNDSSAWNAASRAAPKVAPAASADNAA